MFPTQVVITPSSVTHYTPQWIGKLEESIHMSHVASIKIDTNLMFSDVFIETTGGHNPVVCHGHSKGALIEMKRLIGSCNQPFIKRRSKAGELLTVRRSVGAQVRTFVEPATRRRVVRLNCTRATKMLQKQPRTSAPMHLRTNGPEASS